jgi:hypothetical protein
MTKRIVLMTIFASGLASMSLTVDEVFAQRGRGGAGGAGGGRSAGNSAPSMAGRGGAGPAMSRPSSAPQVRSNSGGVSNLGAQIGASPRPNMGANANANAKPNGGFQRPSAGNNNAANANAANKVSDKMNLPGKTPLQGLGSDRPALPGNAGRTPGSADRTPGSADRPNIASRPGGAADSSQLNDFLGISNRPAAGIGKPDSVKDRLPNAGNANRPAIGNNDVTRFGDRTNNSTNVNIGNVNIGNSVDYTKNQKAWVDNHHATGNQVRLNAGNRYSGAYSTGAYRSGAVGGYPYHNGWSNRGAFHGWQPATFATVGVFMGAAWTNTQPRFIAYGSGGNVYYENNVVYVDGQSAGTPEQYANQSAALVAAAPAQVEDEEWLPLGTFAFTREGVDDSQAMIELAVNKQGVLAGTYYNEATQVSRALKGMLDKSTQLAAIGFADGKNREVILETGIQNLTQDEAPALIHQGKEESTPVLLVRLQPPVDSASN